MVSNKIIKKVPRKSKRYYKENKEKLQKKVRYWYEGLSQEKKIRKGNMLQIDIEDRYVIYDEEICLKNTNKN